MARGGPETPATVLVGRGWSAADRSVRGLARRLARQLGHDVLACDLERPGPALARLARTLAGRGAAHVVVLPLALEVAPSLVERGRDAVAAALGARSSVRIHRGRPPAVDDVARMLGDRARAAAAILTDGGRSAAEVVAVIATSGGANPAANADVARLARLVYEAERFGDVSYAFADVTAPAIGEVVARWARVGARAIVVVPYALFEPGTCRRVARAARAAAAEAGVEVGIARPLDGHPALVWALIRRHLEALADAASMPSSPASPAPWVNPELLRIVDHAHGHGRTAGDQWEARLAALLPPRYREPGVAVSSAPMGAAPLRRDADGRVAWDATWQGFCELALAGGPPHRGALLEPVSPEETRAEPARYAEVRAELARGLEMVTGLPVVLDGSAGWIGLRCDDEEMAIWLMRAIVVENVMVRREGGVLYLPAGPRFTVEGEIRNVVTAVAKTHHYWVEHQAAGRAVSSARAPRRRPSRARTAS